MEFVTSYFIRLNNPPKAWTSLYLEQFQKAEWELLLQTLQQLLCCASYLGAMNM